MSVTQKALDVLIVDDEAPARDELAFLLRQQPHLGRIEEAADAAECLSKLEADHFDAVFLDVRMPSLDGLALARVIGRLPDPPQIVFVTAFDDHAVEAFGLDAVDYLLKPVRPERLGVSIGRLLQGRQPSQPAAPQRAALDDRLPVLSGGAIRLLPVDEIRLAVVEGDHVTVLAPDGHFSSRSTLNQLETRLRPHGFLRVHRRFLVNLKHVASIESFFNGTYLLKLAGLPDLTVPVSRRHAPDLRAAIRL
jgi:two-component system LytT family response regulator/two-component system response regulator LytT